MIATRLCCAMHPSRPSFTSGRADSSAAQSSRRPMQHLLFGMFSNRARVQQHDVPHLRRVNSDVARAAQNGADRLRVGDIHLASVSFEIDSRMRRICGALIH